MEECGWSWNRNNYFDVGGMFFLKMYSISVVIRYLFILDQMVYTLKT